MASPTARFVASARLALPTSSALARMARRRAPSLFTRFMAACSSFGIILPIKRLAGLRPGICIESRQKMGPLEEALADEEQKRGI